MLIERTYFNRLYFADYSDLPRNDSKNTPFTFSLMSAESNLAGFFPPDDSQMWNKNINWQPIPIHTIPERLDNVLAAKRPCQRYDYALKKYQKSPEFQALCEKFKPLFRYLQEKSGAPIRSFDQAQYLYNTLYIENLRQLAYVSKMFSFC